MMCCLSSSRPSPVLELVVVGVLHLPREARLQVPVHRPGVDPSAGGRIRRQALVLVGRHQDDACVGGPRVDLVEELGQLLARLGALPAAAAGTVFWFVSALAGRRAEAGQVHHAVAEAQGVRDEILGLAAQVEHADVFAEVLGRGALQGCSCGAVVCRWSNQRRWPLHPLAVVPHLSPPALLAGTRGDVLPAAVAEVHRYPSVVVFADSR